MTDREKAIKMLKSKMDGHTDTSYEWAETVRMAIKALEQESVLDKIRAEIEEIETYDGIYIDRAYVLQIIDKYKVESEG